MLLAVHVLFSEIDIKFWMVNIGKKQISEISFT